MSERMGGRFTPLSAARLRELLDAARGQQTQAYIDRLLTRLFRVSNSQYSGRRIKSSDLAAYNEALSAFIEANRSMYPARPSRRGAAARAAKASKRTYPWYWNYSEVKMKGKKAANTAYKKALAEAMKQFASSWAGEAPEHGLMGLY